MGCVLCGVGWSLVVLGGGGGALRVDGRGGDCFVVARRPSLFVSALVGPCLVVSVPYDRGLACVLLVSCLCLGGAS